jgi:signal transduction histidine kinase
MKATRVFQLTALALVVVAAVQVGYWLFDQQIRAMEKVHDERALYSRQVEAGQAMLDSGVSAERVRQILPGVAVAGSRATLSPTVDEMLLSEAHRRINQYAWEGGFFLLALALCIGVIARALRAEAKIIQEQDNFLALVSHQFKTPLASLQLSLETMALRTLSPDQGRTLIDRMLSDLGRMEAMVTQILESVRLERGRVDLRREPLDLSGAVTRVVAQFEERAHKDNITITADIARGLYVLTDPLALDVVVRNLSGVGFRPADGVRLFEKFTRLHPGGGSSYYGTGLGLFIVRRLMQLAGGRVSAHSEGVGQGAKFVLTWPVAPAESA